MGDNFTRRVFDWLQQIAADPGLSGLANRVAIKLTAFFNRDSGEAWPRQETLASSLGVSPRGVRKALDSLVTCGHLQVRFEDWWRQYPRKRAKEAARRAYERVLRRGLATREELLAGAMRYAAEQTGRDPNFTKFPANWLNGGCWQDEPDERVAPLPRAPPCATGSGARVDPVQQWLEGRRSRDDEEFDHEQDRAASFRG
jgi:hypothetical protein